MWTDRIGMVCREDMLLKEMGCSLLDYYAEDSEESRMKKTSAHMRTLARLLEEARSISNRIKEAKDLINNRNFSVVCITSSFYSYTEQNKMIDLTD